MEALLLCAALASGAAAADSSPLPSPGGFDLYVSPLGTDSERGDDWARPLKTIQRALELAQPGHRIAIGAGEYFEDPRTVRDGRPGAPISLFGAAGAIVKGAGNARVFEIRHSHLELVNLEIDGKVRDASGRVTFRDKLVYVMGRSEHTGITGVRLLRMRLRNAGGECVRMKYFAHHNEVAYSTITDCGVDDFHGDGGAKNGEGLYIGTAPEQLERNPTAKLDRSNGNWVHHNHFDTRGNECVDMKEGARFNVIEHNACTGQLDENAAGISSRGNDNIIRFNLVWGNRGAGIRFGGDTARDGIDNHAYGNTLRDNAYSAFKIMAWPQGRLCGNHLSAGTQPPVRGSFAKGVDPTAACR
jgi:hypothetical protein